MVGSSVGLRFNAKQRGNVMKKLCVVFIGFIVLMGIVGLAYAGPIDAVKSWGLGKIIALVLGIGINAALFVKIINTFKEAGEFFATLGKALEDKKLTSGEITRIMKEGKDVFNIWRQTPVKYKGK